ncbi:hypothetical protein KXR53_19585 [Inquilinus limosus]|uniref:hypothetical protein n=1 Tax=Inquilinus limosus TaxID=171674 RepID=UPI003F13A32D
MIIKRLICAALLLACSGAAARQDTSSAASPARWLSESRFVISSMETGPVGYLEAWGGSEFGYAYSYSISGAPAGMTVDADTGMLSAETPLAAGTYAFKTSVRNRGDISRVADFPVTLEVVAGVTARRTRNDILHRDYVVDSGEYGTPVGADYTEVLMKIRRAIILDQKAVGDGNLRPTIIFHGGRQYDYVNNRWTFGIQYLEIRSDTPGVRAKLRNIAPNGPYHIASAILQLGRQYFQCVRPVGDWICEQPRSIGYKIDTTAVGDHAVMLKNASDARNLPIGRYVMVGSYDQQMYGFPPNIRYFEYAKVVSISGRRVVLDRPLRHRHKDNYWETLQDPNSLGVARIYAIDRDDQRLTLRARIKDIEFLADPDKGSPGNKLYAAALDMSFENCVIPHFVPTQARFARVSGGSVLSGELDKLVSMVVFDGTTTADLYEGTGVDYLLFKNSNVTSGYGIAPRQLRAIDSTLRGVAHAPLAFKGSWTTQQVDVAGSAFVGAGPVFAEWPPESLTVGQDGVSWDGRRLTVPSLSSSSDGKKIWGRATWEGAIIYADAVRSPNWGIITDITGEADSMYFDIDWKAGPGPTAGTQLYVPRLHDVIIRASRITPGLSWNDTDAGRQITPAGNRPFPEGYPMDRSGS